MSQDTYTVVTTQSWGSRLGGSVKGIFFGLILLVVGLVLLWWNEGRAVREARALEEGAGLVVSINADRVDPGYEGKLVHLSGRAETTETLRDGLIGVEAKAIKLRRVAEMYQWKEESRSETTEKLGGGTETVTTYSYSKDWSEGLNDSGGFKKPEGHQNPTRMPYRSETKQAGVVTLGAFLLSPSLVGEIDKYQGVALTGAEPAGPEAPALQIPAGGKLNGNEIYVGRNPAAPEIGDIRIRFEMVPATVVSLVSRQQGKSFVPYVASNGNTVELLEYGMQTAEQMFQAAQDRNTFITWLVRLGGFIAVFIGLRMLVEVLRILAAVIPALGAVVGGALGLVCGILALILSLLTIASAWLFYRPLLAISLIVAAAGLLFGLRKFRPAAVMPPPAPVAAPAGSGPPPPPPV